MLAKLPTRSTKHVCSVRITLAKDRLPGMSEVFSTHDVFNQSPAFEDVNLYLSDQALVAAVKREGAAGSAAALQAYGAIAGSSQARDLARFANEFPPILKTHDAKGHRIDLVEYHPAYHALMAISARAGLHHMSAGAAPQVTRSALLYLSAQMEAGHCCPMTMTNAALSVLSRQPETGAPWLQKISQPKYDQSNVPLAQKFGLTIGMGMTEKQGGTDVRANTTRAIPLKAEGAGNAYALTGHKWFMSAPMSDAFLVLAQAAGGLTCFLLPRLAPDGGQNGIRLQRLKPKLGNRSNASSEVEFHEAQAIAIGNEGDGIRTIIAMVTQTRLDCAVSSAGLMRSALAHALHHTSHRTVFQKKLADQPLMQQVLADLAIEVEGAVALSFRLARAFDGGDDPLAQAWRRVMTPVAKYWICKQAAGFVAEAMECLGGNGYVEDGTLARIYREVPVNAIWEGSGNVMALDLVRVLQRTPDAAQLVLADIGAMIGGDARLGGAHARLSGLMRDVLGLERNARAIANGLAVLAAAALLKRDAPEEVCESFIATRVSLSGRQTYGIGIDADCARAIIARAMPG